MKLKRISLALLLAALVLGSTSLAFAGPAQDFVHVKQDSLFALLAKPKSAAREKNISEALDQIFDYGELAKRSLGPEWDKRTPAERAQFQELLEKLVRQSYRKHLDKTAGYVVEYKGESNSPGGAVVHTVAKKKSGQDKEPAAIDYVVLGSGGGFHVVDVITEGSSLVNNYRSQFRKTIDKKGWDGLIAKMKAKLSKGG